MRFIILVLLSLLLTTKLVTSQTVVATQGGVCKDTNASMEWTVGEPAVETYNTTQNMITQGFNQPGLVIYAVEEIKPEYAIIVFPNPVNEQLNVTNNGEEKKIFFMIFDVNGKKAASGMFSDNTTVIDMTSLPNGVYLLRFFTGDKNNLKTFKVQKNK